ncbi:MAG: 3-dehydro-L-gulonate 2-dehydrogenase, partial [Spirochaetota bacterium]
PVFIQQVDQGMVKLDKQPLRVRQLAALEQWDCQLGPGPLNGIVCSERAMELADQYGVGVVAMRNSNHWMRGGAYALKVAKAGYACIAVTNSSAVMPAWGAKDMRLGTNPLIIGIPGEPPALLDMSCSQYSYGALEVAKVSGKTLAVAGGYDEDGNLSTDPAAVAQARRLLPTGFWKGSALSIVLDMLVSLLADGNSTVELTEDIGGETAISQMFIVLNTKQTINPSAMQQKLARIVDFTLASVPVDEESCIQIPGYSIEKFIRDHEKNGGMPVSEDIWERIQKL